HDEFRAATRDELAKMRYTLRQALEEGALGFSTGLAYSHAKVATSEEVSALVEEVERVGGVWASHIRGEAEELLPAVNETIQIARESGAAVEISHFKAMGKAHWPNFASAVKMVENAREDGLNITFDCYPYTITGSVLYTVLPDWVEEGGRRELVKRLKDPSVRIKVMEEMRKVRYYEYENVRVAMSTADPAFAGKTIARIAREQGVSGEEAIMNMLLAAEGRVVSFMDTLSEENVEAALKHPLSFVASDGAGYRESDEKKGFLVHPRSFGAFPRFL
ncbi:hypothetical protein HYV98_00850, partial [Candidatus Azambacteria bacterium]|nr:hypothetical protein [Candidatus Azambacteria bacterium]